MTVDNFKSIIRTLSPNKKSLILLVILASFIATADMAVPVAIGRVSDYLQNISETASSRSFEGSLIILLVIGIRPLIILADDLIRARVLHVKITRDFRGVLFKRFLRSSVASDADMSPGRSASIVTQTADSINGVIDRGSRLIGYIIAYLSIGVPLFYVADTSYLVIVFSWILLYIITLVFLFKRILITSGTLYAVRHEYTGTVVDLLANRNLFIGWGLKGANAIHIEKNNEYAAARSKQAYAELSLVFFLAIINTVLILAVIIRGSVLAAQGGTSAFDIVMPITLSWQFTSVAGWVCWEIAEIIDSLGSIESMTDMLDDAQDPKSVTNSVTHRGINGSDIPAINIVNLSFSYSTSQRAPVFSNITTSIAPGETVRLAGASGSGKSTLLWLIAGAIHQDRGEIYFEYQGSERFSPSLITGDIALVMQQPYVLNRTVRENFTALFPDISDDRIMYALSKVSLDAEISGISDMGGATGLDYSVGTDGCLLSGGQKQRLAIARIFLSAPKVILLDEFDSSLDEATALHIWDAIRQSFPNATVIFTAHNERFDGYITKLISL
jgi:ABC-type multidrug transport system fused ATPase/permease subunit